MAFHSDEALTTSLALLGLSGAFLVGHILRHLWLWLADRRDILHLWAVVFSASLLVHLVGSRVAVFTPPPVGLQVGIAIAQLGALGTWVALLRLAGSLGPSVTRPEVGRTVVLLVIVGVGLTLLSVLDPTGATIRTDALGLPVAVPESGPGILALWGLASIGGLVYAIGMVKRSGAPVVEQGLMIVGLAGAEATGLNDLLISAGLLHSVYVFQYSFLVINVALDLILAVRMVRLRDHLEEEVNSQTAELARKNDLLADALEVAEAATRVRTQILANLSHEIRTPLHGILGMTGLVLDAERDPRAREQLQAVRTSAEGLLRLLNNLLDLARLESGRVEVEPTVFSPRQLVAEVLAATTTRRVPPEVELVSVVSVGVPPWVQGDGMRLRQILGNLVDNAVKFTHQGRIAVEVDWSPTVSGAGQLELAVADTGVGIPVGGEARIFEPFVQLSQAPNRTVEGTGLGLAICRQLVTLLGGTVDVSSVSGMGTTFRVKVPVARTPAEAEGRLRGIRVLVAESDPRDARLAVNLLVGLDAAVEEVGQGGLPARTASSEAELGFDLLLLDSVRLGELGRPGLDELRTKAVAVCLVLPAESTTAELTAARDRAGAAVARPLQRGELAAMLASVVRRTALVGDDGRAIPPLRVLVAEDHPVNRRLVVALLERAGHSVVAVGDGALAVAAASPGRFDLILMDVQMPAVDGVEATIAIRKREAGTSRVPIIAFTAFSAEGDYSRFVEAGMDGVVTKPVRVEDLFAEMARVLPRADPSAPAPRFTVEEQADAPVFDQEGFERRTGQDRELLMELAALFVECVPEFRGDLSGAFAAGDPAALGRAAHRLKGAAANMGAEALLATVKRLEEANRHDPLQVEALLHGVAAEFDRLLPVLRGLYQTRPDTPEKPETSRT